MYDQNVSRNEWLSKPVSIILTKEHHERAAGVGEATEVHLDDWGQFESFVLNQPVIVPESWLDKSRTDKCKVKGGKLKGYSLTKYTDRHRTEAKIEALYAIGVDLDESELSPKELNTLLNKLGYRCFWHTTLSHTLERPRYRLIFPFAAPCPISKARHWLYTRDCVTGRLMLDGAARDENAKSLCRFWYWPACLLEEEYEYGVIDGQFLPLLDPVDEEPMPTTERTPITTSKKENTTSYAPFYSSTDIATYDLQWVHNQCTEYLAVGAGGRRSWILKKAHTLGGLYASRSFSLSVSKWAIIDTMHSYVMQNSGSSAKEEMKTLVDAFEAGERKPLESKKKEKKHAFNPTESKAPEDKKHAFNPISEWTKALICKDGGQPKNMQANVDLILAHHPDLAGLFEYDAYSRSTRVLRAIPGVNACAIVDQYPREIRDSDYAALTSFVERNFNFTPRENFCISSVRAQAQKSAVHPIRAYLESLKPAQPDVLSTYLSTIFGADDTAYTRAVARKFLISAVARIFEPGCKVDTMLILEGDQGIQKSTALAVLFGRHFSDSLSDIHTKDACMDLVGRWGVEVGELHKFKTADVDALKAFLSRQVDRYRPPYGREVVDQPRQGILIGTTNRTQYLRDETGARRLWPIACGDIKIQLLKSLRDELFAQAVAAYRSGENWWMDTDQLQNLAHAEQNARQDVDIWQARIDEYVINKDSVAVDEIAEFLGIEVSRRTRPDSDRISACLRSANWRRYRTRRKGVQIWAWQCTHRMSE